MAGQPWWHKGVRFACQGSGRCCVSHGECGAVYLTGADASALARHLGVSAQDLASRFCLDEAGPLRLRDAPGTEACIFLEQRRCSVYAARPTQCRTWPFWPEVMAARRWSAQVKGFCPGVGKGEVQSRETIARALDLQKAADAELQDEVDEAD